MTANQYAKLYKANPNIESLVDIINDLFKQLDANKDKKVRIKSPFQKKAVLVPVWPFRILNELEQKWEEFVKLSGNSNLHNDGFELAVKMKLPVIYGAWIIVKAIY